MTEKAEHGQVVHHMDTLLMLWDLNNTSEKCGHYTDAKENLCNTVKKTVINIVKNEKGNSTKKPFIIIFYC